MSSDTPKINRHLYYWEDFQFKNLKESTVGRKGLSLFELKDMDVPVPEFFVISSSVFDKFISESLLRDNEKLLENGRNPEESEVLNSLLKTEFESEFMDELVSAYTRLSGFTDAWVSVRSSVVFPTSPETSFSGVFSTELNVRGIKNLEESIKRIYASLFTDDVVAYASTRGINLSDVRLAIVVQRMVQAEVSGVVFTVDPITQDPSKLSVEAVFGLGDSISLGELTPDTYLLNKRDLSIIEKRISPQEWMKVRVMSRSDSKSGVEKIKISNSWSHRQKLEDRYLKEISKIALIVENKVRQAQNIEWVMAGGRIWVLQSKDLYEKIEESSIVTDTRDFDTLSEVLKWSIDKYSGIGMLESKAVEHAKKIVQSNKHEVGSFTEKLINAAKSHIHERPKVETVTVPETKEDLLVKGIGASFGQVTGKVIVLEKDKDISISKNDILVIKKYASEMESLIVHCGGVIMETGGITSDTAILCREFDIPAVVGAVNASSILKNGDTVRLDGNSGSVYRQTETIKEELEKKEEVHPVVEAYREENLNGIDLLHSAQPVQQPTEASTLRIPRDMSLAPSATKVFVNPDGKVSEMIDYVGNAHGLVYVDLDSILLSVGRHLLAFIDDKKFVDYSKNISEKICEIVDLAQGDQVILSIGSCTVGEFREITRGKEFESHNLDNSIHGLSHYIANRELLKRVLMIVRRVRNVYKKRNVDIAIHAPMSGAYMKEFKKSLSAAGLRRTSTFKIFAVIDNPTEVIMADDILESKIDGLILNMPRIVRVMQGFNMDDKEARYNLGVNSAFKIVDAIIDITRSTSKYVIVMSENNKDLIKYCVQEGVYGISVNYQDVKDARKLVSDEEAKLILSR
jgi:pyruvate,water dikinase